MPNQQTQRARQLRKKMTDAERKLWQNIRARQLLGFKFRRQEPIGRYIVDFVCYESKLIIELDGGQHLEKQAKYDQVRDGWLRSQGFTVLRFWNFEVLENLDGVLESIGIAVKKPSP
jgi:very-short-patch-repair endonuclease